MGHGAWGLMRLMTKALGTARGLAGAVTVPHTRPLPAIALMLSLIASPVGAQYLTRPQIPWRTINTGRFDIHFPVEMEEWTRHVASRIESYADAVDAFIGNRPESRVTVIVEDPSNVSNGFALPFMEGPVIFLWPTPPSPARR